MIVPINIHQDGVSFATVHVLQLRAQVTCCAAIKPLRSSLQTLLTVGTCSLEHNALRTACRCHWLQCTRVQMLHHAFSCSGAHKVQCSSQGWSWDKGAPAAHSAALGSHCAPACSSQCTCLQVAPTATPAALAAAHSLCAASACLAHSAKQKSQSSDFQGMEDEC